MPLAPEVKASYEVVLNDLETERKEKQHQVSALQSRIKEINHSISTLSKRLYADAPTSPSSSLNSSRQPIKKYLYMSVRWAILDLLAESQPKTTAEIADELLAAGIPTKAANFANNVSAVLSTTMKEQDEVRQLQDGKWELTENGKKAIEHIRNIPKFQGALRDARNFARS